MKLYVGVWGGGGVTEQLAPSSPIFFPKFVDIPYVAENPLCLKFPPPPTISPQFLINTPLLYLPHPNFGPVTLSELPHNI